jgi:hypothetical protein
MTQSITLQTRDDYRLIVTVTPYRYPRFVNLRIESQWLGARDPEGLQRVADLTPPRAQAQQLANLILEEST